MNYPILLCLTLAFGSPSARANDDAQPYDPAWHRCRAAAECRAYRGNCGWRAARHDRLREAIEFEARVKPLADCAGAPRFDRKPRIRCRQERCEAS